MATTEQKFRAILVEEGASRTLLRRVEAHAGLDQLAAEIRRELGIPAAGTRRRIDPRRLARIVAAQAAADRAAWAAKLEGLQAHFA